MSNINEEELIQIDEQNQSQSSFSFQGPHDSQNQYISSIKTKYITSEKKQIYQAYTRFKGEPKFNPFNKHQNHIQITIIQNSNGVALQQNQLYLNKRGLVDSKKNTETEDLIIGRQEKFENDFGQTIYPNDIVLEEKERLISRIHCKIIYKNYFAKHPIIDIVYQKCLQLLQLPKTAIFLISKFLQEPRICFVQDIGSTCGTHLRIEKQEAIKMKSNQQFCVGSETNILVLQTHVLKSNLLNHQDEGYQQIIQTISLEKNKCAIHGIIQNENDTFMNFDIEDDNLNQLINYLTQYDVPFLLLKFTGSGVSNNNIHLFLAQDKKIFTIGRSSDNDFKINSNTISRKQTRFLYNEKKNQWQICDGIEERESANGTWIQLAKGTDNDLNLRYPLKDFSEIKINDYILKLRFFQGKKKKKDS